ncbi:bifunctional phosphoglucose/phosphomannose isomerase [Infirmifilum sp. NZ]|uniref:bifunctional phosphoglucose/phosphomannose isomerase n=1 Tax=Infirmifilum sp. NZ TaxID=2926850 RepID=UPI0027A40B59|nr:bifunctional phosphoglucose/phosphomannose isomerase [Infirmifilum sp. NZ]UNQ72757.1 bifunctional phosphoglucose/phosphomannose isomerase [Infirmifilum sp. NZ]
MLEDKAYTLISSEARKHDPSGMLLHVIHTPHSVLESTRRYREEAESLLRFDFSRLSGVVVSGMGGSFISGLFLYDLIADKTDKPLVLNRDAKLPKFIDKNYLLVTVSYSGNTEETLRVYSEGLKRGIPIVAVTSGGKMAEISEKKGVPLLRLPPGIPPRAAFPHITSALTSVLSLVTGIDAVSWLEEAARELQSRLEGAFSEGAALARLLHEDVAKGLVPLVYGYSPYTSPAYRFKTQLNENSKVHAFFGELPEGNHNEIMGWSGPLANFSVIFLRGREEPEYMRARIEFLEELLSSKGVPYYNLYGEGGGRAGELLSLVFKADVASVALALLRGVDPTPVDIISRLKTHLESRVGLTFLREAER